MINVGSMAVEFSNTSLNETCRDCLNNYGYPCCDDSDDEGGSECGMLETANEEYETWPLFKACRRSV